jgi:hypothetical protein
MSKVKQKNWLVLITVFLFSATAVLLFINTKRNLGIGICLHEGVEYRQNEIIPNYLGKNNCYCSWDSKIECDDEDGISYESFTSESLQFSYSFRNFLEKDTPDFSKITLSDIEYSEGGLKVVLDREALCSINGEAPTQVGMYELGNEQLLLTSITNRDASLYMRSCVIGNTFVLEGFSLEEKDEFKVLYINEAGFMYDLKACFSNGKLYATGDVFKDVKNNMLCTCEEDGVKCEDL